MGARVTKAHQALSRVSHALAKTGKLDEGFVYQRGADRGQRSKDSLVVHEGLVYATTGKRMSVQQAPPELTQNGRVNTVTLDQIDTDDKVGESRRVLVAEWVQGRSYSLRLRTTKAELLAALKRLERESGAKLTHCMLMFFWWGEESPALTLRQVSVDTKTLHSNSAAVETIASTTVEPLSADGREGSTKTLLTAKWFKWAVEALPDGEIDLICSGCLDPVVLRSVPNPDHVEIIMSRRI